MSGRITRLRALSLPARWRRIVADGCSVLRRQRKLVYKCRFRCRIIRRCRAVAKDRSRAPMCCKNAGFADPGVMFGFLTSGTKEVADPLVSPKAVAAWLRQLPALDVIGRQQHVMRAFDGMRQSRKPIDLHRVAGHRVSRRRARRRPPPADQAIRRELRRRAQARRAHLAGDLRPVAGLHLRLPDGARGGAAGSRAMRAGSRCSPLLFARLLHYYGTDAKLRVFRYERWIPGEVDGSASHLPARLRARRRPRARPCCAARGPNATQWTVEQEYLYVLLIHQLNTGNLSPPQLDWAIVAAARVEPAPAARRRAALAGRLLRRHRRQARALSAAPATIRGSMLRYLDTTPLAEQLDRAIAALRQAESTDQGPAAPINQQRIAILEKVRPRSRPTSTPTCGAIRASPCAVAGEGAHRPGAHLPGARARKDIGDRAGEAGDGHEQIEVFAVADGSRAQAQRRADEHDSLAASLSSFSDPMWQVKDRSVAGLRIAASGGIGQSLALGALVAVRQSDVGDWVLGVVRRLNKVSQRRSRGGHVDHRRPRRAGHAARACASAQGRHGLRRRRHRRVDDGRALRRPVPAAAVAARQAAVGEDADRADVRNTRKDAT